MTTEATHRPPLKSRFLDRLKNGKLIPVATICLIIITVWYIGAVYLNSTMQIERFERAKTDWTFSQLVSATLSQDRPLLPAPHQVMAEINKTVFQKNITSKRSLVFHASVTLSSTLLGFIAGTLLGVLLAVGIVHVTSLEKSLMPWIISSQTIPILAIAPMVVVVLGAIGLKGLVPKAIISMYLSFFPVTISMVKGLRSPRIMEIDLMRTYRASIWQTLIMLRLPASLPFLFTGLKIAVAASLVGAIVGELPTGAQAGLGARLLAGSYYGQTIQIWSALIVASILAGGLVSIVGWIESKVLKHMGLAESSGTS